MRHDEEAAEVEDGVEDVGSRRAMRIDHRHKAGVEEEEAVSRCSRNNPHSRLKQENQTGLPHQSHCRPNRKERKLQMQRMRQSYAGFAPAKSSIMLFRLVTTGHVTFVHYG